MTQTRDRDAPSVDLYDRLDGSLESNRLNSYDAELDPEHRPHAVTAHGHPQDRGSQVGTGSAPTFCDREPGSDETSQGQPSRG